jgi:hypothetical protein
MASKRYWVRRTLPFDLLFILKKNWDEFNYVTLPIGIVSWCAYYVPM